MTAPKILDCLCFRDTGDEKYIMRSLARISLWSWIIFQPSVKDSSRIANTALKIKARYLKSTQCRAF